MAVHSRLQARCPARPGWTGLTLIGHKGRIIRIRSDWFAAGAASRQSARRPPAVSAVTVVLLPLLLACSAGGEHADTPEAPKPPAELRATVDRSTATTGDLIRYEVEVERDPEVTVELADPGVDIAGFRIVDLGQDPPETLASGRIVERRWYQLRADLIGAYALPALSAAYSDPRGDGGRPADAGDPGRGRVGAAGGRRGGDGHPGHQTAAANRAGEAVAAVGRNRHRGSRSRGCGLVVDAPEAGQRRRSCGDAPDTALRPRGPGAGTAPPHRLLEPAGTAPLLRSPSRPSFGPTSKAASG